MADEEIEPLDARAGIATPTEPDIPLDGEAELEDAETLGEGETDSEEDLGAGEPDSPPDPLDAQDSHPLHSHPYMTSLNIGKADPVASVRLTGESIMGHLRALVVSYDTLAAQKATRLRHKHMQEIFNQALTTVGKELRWLDQAVTAAMNVSKHMLPFLARLGELRGTHKRVKPWHVLALEQLGVAQAEGAALVGMSFPAYKNWMKKAKKEAQERLSISGDDMPSTPLLRSQSLGTPKVPLTADEHAAILSDPVKRLQWSTKELYDAARTIEDEKIRFQYLSELAEGAQKEAARETERIAEAAMVLLQFVPRLIEHLEQAVETWRAEVAIELKVADVPGLSVRDEAKAAITGYGSFGAQVEAALEKL